MHDDLLTPCTQKKGDLATCLALDSDKMTRVHQRPDAPMGDMINYFKPPHSSIRRLDARHSYPRTFDSRVSRVQMATL